MSKFCGRYGVRVEGFASPAAYAAIQACSSGVENGATVQNVSFQNTGSSRQNDTPLSV